MRLTFSLPVLLLVWTGLLHGQEMPRGELVDTIDTSIDLFEETAPMQITLTLDMKKYQQEKLEGQYMPVHFLYQINDTLRLEKSMRIKARGQFRRKHCAFAPFWINIRKADVKNQYLQDIKRIKIVTHCNAHKSYEAYVLREFLAYKIYNLLTPVSFRVRLIRMRYIDTGRKNKLSESWAFMIEPEDMLAERHQAIVIKRDDLTTGLMKPEEMDRVALFQYMIGNPDYSVAGRHNIKILGLPGFGAEGYTPVPYDFDYSGLVDAYYAEPGEELNIASVRERYFMGPCREDQEILPAMDRIDRHREEIIDLVNGVSYMSRREKRDLVQYLERYFKQTEDKSSFLKKINRTCIH